MGFVDMYYWFFYDTTFSGVIYGPDRFLAMVISGFFTAPFAVVLLAHIEIENERKLREQRLKELEASRGK